ncbi:PilZ domain-containing protein [Sphingomonadaceae bacterium jetA1]|jgi:hypothetical protein|uniref:PilZ domain-containing protein n=1 Tax=Facivitalis istanbulensis TaxID=3075838 RepID=UPI00346D4800
MFAAEFEPAEIPTRRAARAADSEYDQGGLARALCRVLDISLHGVRLQTYTALHRGMNIWLRLPQVGQVSARVVWADDFAAGCQFQEPLAREDFEHLAPLTA